MFDYKKFKKEMAEKGHTVHKKGLYIPVEPDNNYWGTGKGFRNAWNFIPEEYWYNLKFVKMDHFNTYIYYARYKIIE